jgi:hypothetical protein
MWKRRRVPDSGTQSPVEAPPPPPPARSGAHDDTTDAATAAPRDTTYVGHNGGDDAGVGRRRLPDDGRADADERSDSAVAPVVAGGDGHDAHAAAATAADDAAAAADDDDDGGDGGGDDDDDSGSLNMRQRANVGGRSAKVRRVSRTRDSTRRPVAVIAEGRAAAAAAAVAAVAAVAAAAAGAAAAVDVRHDHHHHVCALDGCALRFADAAACAAHRRLHTADRPFTQEMSACGDCATQGAPCAEHRYRAHCDVRMHRCTERGCTAAFFDRQTFARHRQSHRRGRPLACDAAGCTQRFKTAQQLQRHRLTHAVGVLPAYRADPALLEPRAAEQLLFVCAVPDCAWRGRRTAWYEHARKHRDAAALECALQRACPGGRHSACSAERCAFAVASGTRAAASGTQAAGKAARKTEVPHTTVVAAAHPRRPREAELRTGRELTRAGLTYTFQARLALRAGSLAFLRVDFLVRRSTHTILLEVARAVRPQGPQTARADVRRMLRVADSVRANGGPGGPGGPALQVLYVRFNPHAFSRGGAAAQVPLDERFARLVAFLGAYRPTLPLEFTYLYHSSDAGGVPTAAAAFEPAMRPLIRNCVC